jgi:hypothetical protein
VLAAPLVRGSLFVCACVPPCLAHHHPLAWLAGATARHFTGTACARRLFRLAFWLPLGLACSLIRHSPCDPLLSPLTRVCTHCPSLPLPSLRVFETSLQYEAKYAPKYQPKVYGDNKYGYDKYSHDKKVGQLGNKRVWGCCTPCARSLACCVDTRPSTHRPHALTLALLHAHTHTPLHKHSTATTRTITTTWMTTSTATAPRSVCAHALDCWTRCWGLPAWGLAATRGALRRAFKHARDTHADSPCPCPASRRTSTPSTRPPSTRTR